AVCHQGRFRAAGKRPAHSQPDPERGRRRVLQLCLCWRPREAARPQGAHSGRQRSGTRPARFPLWLKLLLSTLVERAAAGDGQDQSRRRPGLAFSPQGRSHRKRPQHQETGHPLIQGAFMIAWLPVLLTVSPLVIPAAEPERSPHTLSASGKVVDAQGKPVAGATVYLREWAALRKQHFHGDQLPSDILATTTTDRHGAFAFRDIALPKPYLDELARTAPFPWDLIVKSSGQGLAWQGLSVQGQRRPVRLPFAPEASLQGRLLDNSGRPVAAASVQVLRLQGLDQPVHGVPTTPGNLKLEGSRISLTATSDAEGRFVLTGLPRNLRAT